MLTDHMARFLKIEVGSMKPQELLNVELKDENIIRATDIILSQGVTKHRTTDKIFDDSWNLRFCAIFKYFVLNKKNHLFRKHGRHGHIWD